MDRTIVAATVYVDSQDPANTGWAWRVEFADGHQESGGADDAYDGTVECAGYGAPAGLEEWTHHPEEGGYYEWRAE